MLPMILKLRIIEKGGKRFSVWLPLFLIWIIVFPLLIIPFPLILLAALLMWPSGKGVLVLQGYFTIFKILGLLSGLKVDIGSKNNDVYIVLK